MHKKEIKTEAEHSTTKDNGDDLHLSFESENLAVPEVHTNKATHQDASDNDNKKDAKKDSDISFDNLAMPEIHFKKKNKTEE